VDLRTGGNPGGADSLFYDFILRDGSHFTFAWHNTAGALKEGKGNGWDGTPEDGARIVRILGALPPTDVQMGTASRQLELMGMPRAEWPDVRWLIDPTDYLRPIVFDANDKAWKDPRKERKLREFCGDGHGGHDGQGH